MQDLEAQVVDKISLDDTPKPALISLDVNSTQVSPEIAEKRAEKAHYALEDTLPHSREDYAHAINNGEEDSVRTEASAKVNANRANNAYEQIQNYVSQRSSLDHHDAQMISDIRDQRQTNPASVFEETLGQKYASSFHENAPPWLEEANKTNPQVTSQVTDRMSLLGAKYAFTRKMEEQFGQVAENQSWGGFLTDQAKGLVPLYTSIKERGLIPGAGTNATLGGSLEEQRKALFRLPFDEFVDQYPKILAKLSADNPSLAASFAHDMAGMSLKDQFLSSAGEVADIATLGSFAKPLITGAKTFMKAAASMEARPVRAVAAAARGDMGGAAIAQSAEDISAGLKDSANPIETASRNLASGLRQDKVDATANPGNFGADIINRINQTIDQGENFFKELNDSFRVNRTPALAVEDVMRQQREAIIGKFKGVDNSIMDMSDPIWFGQPNVYYRELHLGTPDGELFDSYGAAKANAERNGYVISGDEVKSRIATIEEELKTPLRQEDDVHGINYRAKLESELQELKKPQPKGGYEIKEGVPKEPKVPQVNLLTEVNKQFGLESSKLNKQIADLGRKIVKSPQDRRPALLNKLTDFKKQLESLESWHADKLAEPGIKDINYAQPGYKIEQQGPKYYINYIHPVSEVDDVLRDGALALEGSDVPQSMFGNLINATIGGYRTPEDTLSKIENEQRKIATHTPSRFEDLATKVLEPIQKLRKGEWKNLDRLLKFSQNQQVLFKGPGQIEDWYMRNVGQAPSIRELHAYFAAKTGLEMDRMLREISVLRNKWRQGVESHNIIMHNADGVPVKSNFFDGIKIDHLPNDEDQIAILGRRMGEEKFTLSHFIAKEEREGLNFDINNGSAKVIKLWNPDLKPLEGFTDAFEGKRIRYVVARTGASEVKPLTFDAVPRLGGGHLVPEYDWYSKQAIIDSQRVGARQDIYTADRTIGAHRNRAEGEGWVKHMNTIREMIRDGDITSAKTYASRYMDENWDRIYDFFKERRDPQGKKLPPLIDKDQPIMMVAKNKRTIDMGDSVQKLYESRGSDGKVTSTFRDGTRSGNDAKMSEIEYTGERNVHPDFFSVEDRGSKNNPLFTFQPAKYIDPITMLNRGLSRIIKSTWMDDYKIYAVENFAQQAKSFLDVDTITELRNSPFYHLFQQGGPRFKSGLKDENMARQLQQNWKKVKDFIGIPSEADTFLRGVSEKLQDSIYKAGGAKGAKIADTMVPRMTDPLAFVQKMAYHFAMGLFSIPQFFTQLSTHTNLFALSPRYASSGSAAMLLHSWSTWNESPQIMAHLDKLASRISLGQWKPGWWSEANREFVKSGFGNIGGEHIFIDTPWSAKLLTSGKDQFLSWGELPFKLGAKSIRTSSFYTSYLEWRTANPTAQISREARASILDRATLYDHNQSRASSSALNQGILRPAMQFQSYSLRLAEMMYGKRLNPFEKARLFGVSAVMYGVPIGGIGLYAFPASDMINKKLKDHGYVLGENAISDIAVHGLASEIMHTITGHRYNIEKFGAKGVDVIGNGLDGDKTWMDIFGGASWSLASSAWAKTSAYRMWASSVINGDQQTFPITLSDVLDSAKIITSVRHVDQGYIGMTTGHWVSSNDNYLTDVSALNAFLMSFSGLTPLQVPEAYLTQKQIQDREATDKVTLVEFLKATHRMALASQAGDDDQAKKFAIQAAAFMAHYPDEKKSEALKLAYDNERPYIDRVNFNYFMKDVDPARRAQFRDQFMRMKQQGTP